MITPLVSFGHCIVCRSFYGVRLPLWYLLATVLSVGRFTVLDKDTKGVIIHRKTPDRQYNGQKIPKG
jgi:hypothetical protein